MEIKTLIESAIRSLSSNCGIELIMLQAQTIAHLLKDEGFKKWVDCEQNGYKEGDVPSYRSIPCQVTFDIGSYGGILTNQILPSGLLERKYNEYLFRLSIPNPITELEKLSQQDGVLGENIDAHIYPLIQKHSNGYILNAKKTTSCANVTPIMSTVKSKLLDFFSNLTIDSR